MNPPTQPTVTKEKLLDAIIDMADFLDGICRLRRQPSTKSKPPSPPRSSTPKAEGDTAEPTISEDDDSAILDIPEEEPIELASLSSTPSVRTGNPFSFQQNLPTTTQPLRAPLAQLEAEMCDTEVQTDACKMADKAMQTSVLKLSTPNNSSIKDCESGGSHIVGQPSLVQLWKGLLFASLSAFFFSVCSAIVKHLSYIHVTQLGAVRFTGILLLSFPVAVTRDEPLFGTKDTRLMMIIRGISGATSLVLRFFAFQRLPLGDASTIIFSVPVFVAVLARVFLKEACSIFHMITVFLTIFGIILITKLPVLFGTDDVTVVTGEDNGRLHGIIAALSSCIFAATVIILLRKLKETDPYIIMFNFGWIALLLCSVLTVIFQGTIVNPKNLKDSGLLVVLAVLSFFGQLALTYSLRTEQAGPVSVMRSTVDIVLVFIWQILFFHQTPDEYTIAGTLLVTTCVILTGFRKWVLSLPEESSTRRKCACCL